MALEFEEPALVDARASPTRSGRASPAAPTRRSCARWTRFQEREALEGACRSASGAPGVVLAFDDAVSEAVARLKERGFDSPYLKTFVVARVNPLRFMKGARAAASTSSSRR